MPTVGPDILCAFFSFFLCFIADVTEPTTGVEGVVITHETCESTAHVVTGVPLHEMNSKYASGVGILDP